MKNICQKTHDFCKSEKYIGYSLYDSHNGYIPFDKFGSKISFLVNQVIKRSPINLRPLLGIKKGINPKGYGLFLHAYSLLSKMSILDQNEAAELATFFYEWLLNNPSEGYSGLCWGYNYHWPKRDGSSTPAYVPSVVVTGFIARGFLAYYEAFHDKNVIEVLNSSAEFVINDVHIFQTKEGCCFSYTPLKKDLCVNANLLAAEVLAYCDYLNTEKKYQDYIKKVIKFTMNHQNKDGSWYYSFDYNNKKPKNQIDFHQGYVLESLLRISQYTQIDFSEYQSKLRIGLDFYYNNQFNREGWAYWRYPSKFPIDIHNQSQGIITFSKFKNYGEKFLPFAEKIAQWTTKNMKGSSGNFYYQKWPLITNKTNYLRWNQAWMFLALVTFLSNKEKNCLEY